LVVTISFGLAGAQSFDVDNIEGLWSHNGDDYLDVNTPIAYNLRLNNTRPAGIAGMMNGWRVYSPDGATWTPLVIEDMVDYSYYYTLVNENGYNGNDGAGADTAWIRHSGLTDMRGFPAGYNRIVNSITTQVTSAQEGLHLCIDSSYFPPQGLWFWLYYDHISGPPAWGGPYCYTIVNCCQIRGDADLSGSDPDVADLVFLVSYMFQGGEEPQCLRNCDVNGDEGEVPDISDLVYLVTYMFQSGPEPVPCPE
jgi:hypothetical protein